MPRHPYYNFNKINGYSNPIKMICGGRGIGKTYGAQKKVIKAAIEKGDLFIYLRRYSEELAMAKASFFEAVGNEFPNHEFRVRGMFAEFAPLETQGQKKREWFLMGYFISLSKAQAVKSAAFPRVKTVIFDEFILEKGFTRYIPGEADLLVNFYNTVDRYLDKTTFYLLANAVSIDNPYFTKWKIRPDEVGAWITDSKNFIVAHFPDSDEFKKSIYATKFGQFIEDTDYADYAVGNQFKDNHSKLVRLKDPDAQYRFTLETSEGIFSVWRNPISGTYYLQEKRPKEEDIFTLESSMMSENKTLMPRNSKTLQSLRTAFNSANMYFDGPRARNAFVEINNR